LGFRIIGKLSHFYAVPMLSKKGLIHGNLIFAHLSNLYTNNFINKYHSNAHFAFTEDFGLCAQHKYQEFHFGHPFLGNC